MLKPIALAALLIAALQVNAEPLFSWPAPAEAMAVTLSGPLEALIDDDGDDPQEHSFELSVGPHVLEVAVRQRGKFRRANCSFPPLRLNFKKKATQGTPFDGADKIKLVTHCKSSKSYELNVLEEYNAYRILNLLTDASFRVRLLRVRYEAPGAKPFERYGFVIEDDAMLAERLGGEIYEPTAQIDRADLDAAHATTVAIFQYLIGNTDFSSIAALEGQPCCHNGRLIRVEGRDGLYSVPYDFDMAGLVNAPYATPNPAVKIRSVRQRRYWGFCTDAQTLATALDAYADLRAPLAALFEETPGMSAKDAQRAVGYLDGFFDELDKRGDRRFRERCRG